MLNKKRYVRMLTGLTALLLGLCGCAVPPETTSAPSGVQAPVAPANVPEKPDAADAGGAPVTLNLADFGAAGNGQAEVPRIRQRCGMLFPLCWRQAAGRCTCPPEPTGSRTR